MIHSSRDAQTGFEFELCKFKLGSGGSGAVFLAQHRHTKELVAVKRLFAKGVGETPTLQHTRGEFYESNQHNNNNDNNPCYYNYPAANSASTSPEWRGSGIGVHGDEEVDIRSNNTSYDKEQTQEENEEKENQRESPVRVPLTRPVRPPCESTILQYLGPHPHIVKFLGSYTTSSRITFFAMELMDSDLGRELRASNTAFMNEDILRPLLHGVTSAIAHLHKRGISHRDIKPSNILIKRVDNVRTVVNSQENFTNSTSVVDFNVANLNNNNNNNNNTQRTIDEQFLGTNLEKKEYVKATLGDFSAAHFINESENISSGRGTLYYKSPEQLMGRAENYLACDMWALGCTMFELSTGSVAFCGSTDLQVLHQIHAKLGTDFPSFPRKIREATLFDSLCAPSSAFLDILRGLLTLDPCERLTASEVLKHPFFDSIRENYGIYNDNIEVTFPLTTRCRKSMDSTKLIFHSIINTPTKRSRTTVKNDKSSHIKNSNINLDTTVSYSAQRCSMWSSSFSATPSPSALSVRLRTNHESIDASHRPLFKNNNNNYWGNCNSVRRLSISSCTHGGVGGISTHGKDDNSKGLIQGISPVAFCFSPATSIKQQPQHQYQQQIVEDVGGGGGNYTRTGSLPVISNTNINTAAAAAAVSFSSQHNKSCKFTPSSNLTLGNTRTGILFEKAMIGYEGQVGSQVLCEEDTNSYHRCDGDSPGVRKILFGSPQQPLFNQLNDSFDKGEGTRVMEEVVTPLPNWKKNINQTPQLQLKTSPEKYLPLVELFCAIPGNSETKCKHNI